MLQVTWEIGLLGDMSVAKHINDTANPLNRPETQNISKADSSRRFALLAALAYYEVGGIGQTRFLRDYGADCVSLGAAQRVLKVMRGDPRSKGGDQWYKKTKYDLVQTLPDIPLIEEHGNRGFHIGTLTTDCDTFERCIELAELFERYPHERVRHLINAITRYKGTFLSNFPTYQEEWIEKPRFCLQNQHQQALEDLSELMRPYDTKTANGFLSQIADRNTLQQAEMVRAQIETSFFNSHEHIAQVFTSRNASLEDMSAEFQRSEYVWLLTGRGNALDTHPFHDLLAGRGQDDRREFCVLLPSPTVPTGHTDWLHTNNAELSRLTPGFTPETLRGQISSNSQVFLSPHTEASPFVRTKFFNAPHIGRIVCLEQCLYFNPYHSQNRGFASPVLKFRSGTQFYDIFSRYFLLCWENGTPCDGVPP